MANWVRGFFLQHFILILWLCGYFELIFEILLLYLYVVFGYCRSWFLRPFERFCSEIFGLQHLALRLFIVLCAQLSLAYGAFFLNLHSFRIFWVLIIGPDLRWLNRLICHLWRRWGIKHFVSLFVGYIISINIYHHFALQILKLKFNGTISDSTPQGIQHPLPPSLAVGIFRLFRLGKGYRQHIGLWFSDLVLFWWISLQIQIISFFRVLFVAVWEFAFFVEYRRFIIKLNDFFNFNFFFVFKQIYIEFNFGALLLSFILQHRPLCTLCNSYHFIIFNFDFLTGFLIGLCFFMDNWFYMS